MLLFVTMHDGTTGPASAEEGDEKRGLVCGFKSCYSTFDETWSCEKR